MIIEITLFGILIYFIAPLAIAALSAYGFTFTRYWPSVKKNLIQFCTEKIKEILKYYTGESSPFMIGATVLDKITSIVTPPQNIDNLGHAVVNGRIMTVKYIHDGVVQYYSAPINHKKRHDTKIHARKNNGDLFQIHHNPKLPFNVTLGHMRDVVSIIVVNDSIKHNKEYRTDDTVEMP